MIKNGPEGPGGESQERLRDIDGSVPTGDQISQIQQTLTREEELILRLGAGKGLKPEERLMDKVGANGEALRTMAAIEEEALAAHAQVEEALEEAGMPGLPGYDQVAN
jgi:hypothetical protein